LLRIGYTPSAEIQLLPRVLRGARERCSQMEFCLQSLPSSRQLIAIQNEVIDVGLIRLPLDLGSAKVKAQFLGAEPLILALPEDSPFAARKAPLALSALRDLELILFRREMAPSAYDGLLEAARAKGVDLRVSYEVESLQGALSLVCGGLGVAVVPASARSIPRSGVVFLPLKPPTVELQMGLLTRQDAGDDPLVSVFAASVIDVAAALYTPIAWP
jgi:DNA-binding transcriptional LysR family regulator